MNTPNKYQHLQTAQQADLHTPSSILISSAEDPRLTEWLAQQTANRFIVRSAQTTEDNQQQSLAGHFWSSEAVEASVLIKTVKEGLQKNQDILGQLKQAQTPQVMVQDYIEHKLGGVLFAPWGIFNDYMHIEYSGTGVKQVVAGESTSVILNSHNADLSPLTFPKEHAYLEPLLCQAVKTLHSTFDFPVDCEWAYCEQRKTIIILQVRPQTHLSGAIKVLPEALKKQTTIQGTYTSLSESLGKLSLLSFSLLTQLYQDARPLLKRLGCQAQTANFMHYCPDGTVLVEEDKETDFFALTRWGGFWRGLRSPLILQSVHRDLQQWDMQTKQASYERLSLSFQYWLCANLLTQGIGREKINELSHAYELGWYQAQSFPKITLEKPTWERLQPQLRQLFFFELSLFKQELQQTPTYLFCTWHEYQQHDFSKAKERQAQQAQLAIYDYTSLNSTSSANTIQSLAATKAIEAPAFIVKNPTQFQGKFPENCLVIAPYFNNDWVHQLSKVKGVIVNRGGHLAHSVLVARELDIPYCLAAESITQTLQQGATTYLNPIEQQLSQ